MVIERTVKELLDGGARRVIIPGFGAFLRRSDGSLTFSGLLTADDGALREATARTASLSDRQAATAVADYSHSLREALASTGQASVAGVGTIFRHDDGKVDFIPVRPAAAPDPTPAETADATTAPGLSIPHTGCTRRLRTALYGDRDETDDTSAQEIPAAAPGESAPCDDKAATIPDNAESEPHHGTAPESEPASPKATVPDTFDATLANTEDQSVHCPVSVISDVPATPGTASATADDMQEKCAGSPAAEDLAPECRAEESARRMNAEDPKPAAPVPGGPEYATAADGTPAQPEDPLHRKPDGTPMRTARNDRHISRAALFGPEDDDAEADTLHASVAAPETTGAPHSTIPGAVQAEAAAEQYRPQVHIRRPERPRRKVDYVVVLAVAAAIIALSVLVYGYLTERNINQQEIILFDPADTAEPAEAE